MDKNAIKKYAIWARRELISRVSQKAVQYGITEESFGDPEDDSVDGRVLTKAEKQQRQTLIRRIKAEGYRQVMEEAAYTWFNRFIALRFMEVNGYLPSHVRVFTDDQGSFKPQILTEAINLDLDGLDMEKVYALKDANKTEELYKYLLIVQCNALNPILPGMFQRIEDYTELLFPDNLLREGSVIERMVRQGESDSIPESDWTDQVQIIGWLYQYYNTEPKDQVFADLKKNIKITKEKIPAATQLFTPDWIVRYMVENSLGRLWVGGHPSAKEKFLPVHNEDGSVRKEEGRWNYYLEEAEQEPEVQAQLAEIRKEYAALTPEEIRVIDPCCGSGHILCYLFDVLEQIYEDYGYTAREAAQKIVQHNLHGLDIDPRAVQLSYFAVMMKARQYDRRFFARNIQPMVYSPEGYPEGMEYGSLITVDELEPAPDFDNWTLHDGDYLTALNRWSFRYVLHQKYHVVVTNPPYLSAANMSGPLSVYVRDNYLDSKSDLCTCFIQRGFSYLLDNGLSAMITMESWMSLSSFKTFREIILQEKSIITLLHMPYLGKGGTSLGINFGTAATVIGNRGIYEYNAQFSRVVYTDCDEEGVPNFFPIKNEYYNFTKASNFELISGSPVSSYYATKKDFECFKKGPLIGEIATPVSGTSTGDNDSFLRFWHEVSYPHINFSAKNGEKAPLRWFPCNKGGAYRKWAGGNEYVIDWENDGYRVKNCPKAYLRNVGSIFRPGLTWSKLGSGAFSIRYFGEGFICESIGCCLFEKQVGLLPILALLNSCVGAKLLAIINPSMGRQPGYIGAVPFIMDDKSGSVVQTYTKECIYISQADWDCFEPSWDYQTHPLVRCASFSMAEMLEDAKHHIRDMNFIKEAFVNWSNECYLRFEQLKANEEKLNRMFIDIYGLQDELTPEVEDKDVTVRKADLQREIRSFISYAVGCMFGRYSLDMPGLAFAGGNFSDRFINAGNPLTDENGGLLVDENGDYLSDGENCYSVIRVDGEEKLTTFAPDYDNILPICDDEYFEDDIVRRFVEFVETIYGKDTLEENLKYIADALGGKGSPRDVIRNYFLNDFYADHLKVYQKRPIYWLFDSGKKNGFRCLIYMHRYQPDTIARIRTDYVHELQSRYRTAIDELERRISDAATAERVKLNKQLAKLQAQADELRDYEEKIHHLADQMISIDLDDGVKVNYAKFQDVMAKIK